MKVRQTLKMRSGLLKEGEQLTSEQEQVQISCNQCTLGASSGILLILRSKRGCRNIHDRSEQRHKLEM